MPTNTWRSFWHRCYYHPISGSDQKLKKKSILLNDCVCEMIPSHPRPMMAVIGLVCVVHSIIRFCYYPYDAIQLMAPQMVHSAFVGWLLHTMYLINLIMWRWIRAVRENPEAQQQLLTRMIDENQKWHDNTGRRKVNHW